MSKAFRNLSAHLLVTTGTLGMLASADETLHPTVSKISSVVKMFMINYPLAQGLKQKRLDTVSAAFRVWVDKHVEQDVSASLVLAMAEYSINHLVKEITPNSHSYEQMSVLREMVEQFSNAVDAGNTRAADEEKAAEIVDQFINEVKGWD